MSCPQNFVARNKKIAEFKQAAASLLLGGIWKKHLLNNESVSISNDRVIISQWPEQLDPQILETR